MSNSKLASVKIVYGSDIRRTLAPSCFSDLRRIIIDAFPSLQSSNFVVKYVDDEGEWITASTDADLVEAISVGLSQTKVPKFVVTAQADQPVRPSSSATSSEPAVLVSQTTSMEAASPLVGSPTPASPSASLSGSSAAVAPDSAPEATFPPLPSIGELVSMLQEFFCGAYSRTHKVVEEELPAIIQILLSESTLAAGATVRSVVDTLLAASNIVRQHPVVIQLLQYLEHPRVIEPAQRLLQKLQAISSSGHLVAVRDRVLGLITQLPTLVSMLPIVIPALLTQISGEIGTQMPAFGKIFGFGDMFCAQSSAAPSFAAAFSSDASTFPQSAPSDRGAYAHLSVSELKTQLAARGLSSDGLLEKADLIEKLVQNPAASAGSTRSSPSSSSSGPAPSVHMGVSCDGCRMSPIVGSRFKCAECPNFDLCGPCRSKGLHSHHHLVELQQPVQAGGPWRRGGRCGGGFGFGGRGGFMRQMFGGFGQQGQMFGGFGQPHHPGGHRGAWSRRAPEAPTASASTPSEASAQQPEAQFVRDVSYPDRSAVGVGKTLVKTWLVKNSGVTNWPVGTKLVFTRGDRNLAVEPEFPVTQPVAPGASVEVSVVLRTPMEGGRYSVVFQLADSACKFFGPRLWADLVVENGSAEGEPLRGAAAADTRFAAQLKELEAMGFGLAMPTMLMLLEANHGDVQAVVSRLLGQ